MTSRTTPPLLEPYLLGPHNDNANDNDAPTAALVLVTGVIGASTNWLVLRQLHSLLKPAPPPSSSSSSAATTTESSAENGSTPAAAAAAAVVLVSFLRDYAFWRDSLARLGVDLEGAARRGRFGYVDGLGASLGVGSGQGQQQLSTGGGRNAPLAARPGGAGGAGGKGWMRTLTASSITSHGNEIGIGSAVTVMQDLSRVVGEVLELLRKGASSSGSGVDGNGEGKEKKVVLVIDGLDFLLAVAAPAGSDSQSDSPPAVVVRDALMDLREQTDAAVVTLAADDPLIKEQQTTLEKNHAWLALSLAHEADTVLSLRLLDTGTAKDVSGVIRITHGGGNLDTKDHEYLYHVAGDGGVRVFERGQ